VGPSHPAKASHQTPKGIDKYRKGGIS